MLTHPRPKLFPDLATALNTDAAKDEPRRKWWSRLLAAHLECVNDCRKDCDSIEIEAHEGAIFSISTDGTAMVVLRHELTDMPAGRATIKMVDARRYIDSKGWAPLSATAERDTFPDVRVAISPIKRPWQELASGAYPIGIAASLLALPAQVARRLNARGVIELRMLAAGALDPVHITAKIGAFKALVVVMPLRLQD